MGHSTNTTTNGSGNSSTSEAEEKANDGLVTVTFRVPQTLRDHLDAQAKGRLIDRNQLGWMIMLAGLRQLPPIDPAVAALAADVATLKTGTLPELPQVGGTTPALPTARS
ncbi:MAG: hypothetical protein AAGA90_23295 [Actinomycetota bacterium]